MPASDDFSRRYGPWAVVTGATDGLGRAFALELGARGLDLVIAARRTDGLRSVAASLRGMGRECDMVAADLATPAGVAALHEAALARDVGLLVCAAGYGSSGPILQAGAASELAMVDLNCRAVLGSAMAMAPRMASRGRGGIVLLSSLLAFQGVRGAANYAATKAYVQVLGEGLRAELGPHGVDVLTVAPGPVRSGFAARAGMRMGATDDPRDVAGEALRRLRGGGTVRPGRLSKLLEGSLAPLPRGLRTAILSRVMAGMTAHQGAT